jgi:predicted kinase
VPLLAITTGLSGSGKSSVAAMLSESVGALRLRSDVERKRLHGLQALERASAEPGFGLYRAESTQRTYARLAELARAMLAGGQDVIVDAAFLARADREHFAELASDAGARFRILLCSAPLAVLRERIASRARGGSDASDADLAVLEAQLRARDPLSRTEWEHAIELRTDRSREELSEALSEVAAALS